MTTLTKHKYSQLVEDGRVTSLTWYLPDGKNHTVTKDHPNFTRIQNSLRNGAPHETVMRLFSNKTRVNEYFNNVGLHGVFFNGSAVLIDGKAIPSDLSKLIIDHVDAGTDPAGLVAFFRNLLNNPSYQSQKELVSFIVRHGLTITNDGHFIAYKGLRADDTSVHSGTAFVDGKVVNGHIPNKLGSIVTMPRGQVDDDRSRGCSTGLHAGTWSYASNFGQNNTVRVKINPADVISVPKDSNEQKLRVCRYEVVEVKLNKPSTTLVWGSESNTGTYSTTGTTTLWRNGEGVTSTTVTSAPTTLWRA